MRACWEALHSSFAQSVRTLEAEKHFEEIKQLYAELGRFDDPISLLGYLNSPTGDLDEKDAIYGLLATRVQGRGDDAEIAMSLLWLGLWPALDAIYGRRLRAFADAPGELVSEISDRFTHLVHDLDLERVHRVAATLTRSTERDVMERRRRYWRDTSRQEDDELSEFHGGLRTTSPRDPSEFGVPAGASDEDEVEAIRTWLSKIVGADADLVIGAAIYGENQREVADRLGLTHEAARKRFQRAMSRIRQRLGVSD